MSQAAPRMSSKAAKELIIQKAKEIDWKGADVDEVLRGLHCAIFMKPQDKGEEIPLGASKFGGEPDLPASWAWPEHEGEPLSFYAQLNFSEVTQYDGDELLPKQGIAYFFVNVSDFEEGYWGPKMDGDVCRQYKVLYCDGPLENLERRGIPQAKPEHGDGGFSKKRLSFSSSFFFHGIYEEGNVGVVGEPDIPNELIDYIRELNAPEITQNRILGVPEAIQGAVEDDWDDIYRRRHRKNKKRLEEYSYFVLLMQLSPSDFGSYDDGLVYFGIPRDALDQRRFDEAVLCYQCT